MSDSDNPRGEYERRLEKNRGAAARCAGFDLWVSRSRLAVFLAGLVAAVSVFRPLWLYLTVIALFVIAFLSLVILHEIILRRKERSDRIIAFYERALQRLDGRWAGRGKTGEDLMPDNHTYAGDLDIFGEGSLFELICAARTRAGEGVLASWLCKPASARTIRIRQQAVKELRLNLDLREDLVYIGTEVREGVRPQSIASWASAPRRLKSRAARIAAIVLAVLALAALGVWLDLGLAVPFVAVVMVELIFTGSLRKKVKQVELGVDSPSRELKVLAGVLARLEREAFQSRMLVDLQGVLKEGAAPASRLIARLERLVNLINFLRNPLFALLAFPVLWGVHLAYLIEDWRENWGGKVPCWLQAVGELEALCSLAAYAYEHPHDSFPEIVEDGTIYDAVDMGHPLIPEKTCIRNNFLLGERPKMMVVSGSNMSGKSTLLRTVGINTVLAHAGAPVHAGKLRLSPLSVGAAIRIHDSIQSGTSRFYMEITRLKQVMDMTSNRLPVLFLLDELLHGTNSHDRSIGAAAVVRAFVEAGAIGLITTHDLALTEIVDEMGPDAANVHFMDHFEDGKQIFDYRLRPGVVSDSNALKLMRSIGLEV